MRRVLKLALSALLAGVCLAATPPVLALVCDQMFYYGHRTCFLSGEDEEWCYYECY
jgi:hypothetical protein